MRFVGQTIQIGRWEDPPQGRERLVFQHLIAHAKKAEPLYRIRWPEKSELWDRWNVAVISGHVAQPSQILFQWWKGFGWEVFPSFVAQICYTPSIRMADRQEGRTTDPTLLHRAWELLGREPVPDPDDKRSNSCKDGWRERYLAFGSKFERTRICDHPQAQTQSGLDQLLASRKLTVTVDGYGTPKLGVLQRKVS